MEKIPRKKAVAQLVIKVKGEEETTTIVVAQLQIDFCRDKWVHLFFKENAVDWGKQFQGRAGSIL